ncbi:MAG: hypothetical protein IPO80_01300 [Propionibacteriaceae bacterium]|nr:hypothetical protein [Propionibacteriaceae bacterium]
MTDNTADLWAWLYAEADDQTPVWADVTCVAVVEPTAHADVTACLAALEASDVQPDRVVIGSVEADLDADWVWLLSATARPAPDALRHLLTAVERHPEFDVIGPLLIEPRRRGPGVMISQFGQTLSAGGRLRGLVEPGELFQGQLETTDALGVDACGMLVRGSTWKQLGGLNDTLPPSHRGIDFGWRATLAGARVAVEPSAHVVDRSPEPDGGDARAAGLALAAGHQRKGLGWLGRAGLVLGSLLAALGYLIGKDPHRAGDELTGLWRWLTDSRLRASVAAGVAAVAASPEALARAKALRPARWSGLRRVAEAATGRFSSWLATFTERGHTVGLDEMTGDDFAPQGTTDPRLSALLVGLVATIALALAAGRSLFGAGSLQGSQLPAAPSGWLDLIGDYLTRVPGGASLTPTPWAGLFGLASFVTAGRPDWLASAALLGCVPLAWLAAFRWFRQLLASATVAGVAAFCYALLPVLSGIVNTGSLAAALWTVLLPIAAYSATHWVARPSWRGAGVLGLWSLLACAAFPLLWVVVLGLAVIVGLRRGRWGQLAVMAASPLLVLVSPWATTLVAYPGRLVTGIEPSLAPTAALPPWDVLLGRGVAAGAPPLWLSLAVFGTFWLVALAGALRRPRWAGPAFVVATVAAVVAIALGRFVVWVPPGAWARPQPLAWIVVMGGALVCAAAVGLDGIGGELRGATLGLRHLGTLSVVVALSAVVVLGAGWWVVAGQSELSRGRVSSVPAFVSNAQVSATPGRTLALEIREGQVAWSLQQDDFVRLGDIERGPVLSGDPAAAALAASVVTRLTAGSADDDLLDDLVTLGVSHVWLGGGSPALRTAIGNTPGLGVGTGDDASTVWPVPESGRAVVLGESRTLVGNGGEVPVGRTVRLAEAADPDWWATVAGQPLAQVAAGEPGQSFDLAGRSGPLEFGLRQPVPWWAWLQALGLAVLMVLAAPSLTRRPGGDVARRVDAPQRVEAAAPRRAFGGEA